MQDIYIGDTGKGFPLVLVHGFLGSSKMWEPQIEVLKKNYRVVAPDLPGFGKSNKAKSYDNINDMAQTILDCLKEKKIEKFYLLGHSMGGMIVQEMTKLAGRKEVKKKIVQKSTQSLNQYQEKQNKGMSIFSYLMVSVISVAALILLLDTFKHQLISVFPNLDNYLVYIFETLNNIYIIIKDLFISYK